MEIKGKVHCFFEQSGTFKNEFKKLGIPAFDYDIQDHFGQTDHYDDLFQAIDDAFKKPTAYWFVNCKPTFGQSFTTPKEEKSISSSRGAKAGLCSEERSMISSDYARNFICDFILGKEQEYSERSLFEE